MRTSTTEWVASKLEEHTEVDSVEIKGNKELKIRRRKFPFVDVLVTSARVVELDVLEQVLKSNSKVEFICNVPKDSYWDGDVIERLQEAGIGWGGFGDLMSALQSEEVTGFQKKEYAFVERALKQHTRVVGYKRIYDRVFDVMRTGLPTLRVVLIYAYEMTAEDLRSAVDKYGHFDIILRSNPNGGPTQEALAVAKDLGCQILAFREFLGRLNRK